MEVADFVSEFFKKPAALWHIIYDDEIVGEVHVCRGGEMIWWRVGWGIWSVSVRVWLSWGCWHECMHTLCVWKGDGFGV